MLAGQSPAGSIKKNRTTHDAIVVHDEVLVGTEQFAMPGESNATTMPLGLEFHDGSGKTSSSSGRGPTPRRWGAWPARAGRAPLPSSTRCWRADRLGQLEQDRTPGPTVVVVTRSERRAVIDYKIDNYAPIEADLAATAPKEISA